MSDSLIVLLTYACQLNCAYCLVVRKPRAMSKKTLRATVDLAFSSSSPTPQLRFFGGEPLLRFDLIRHAIEYGRAKERRLGKSLRFMITTNGLLLDERKIRWLSGRNVEIMLSIDGSSAAHRTQRPAVSRRGYHPALLRNLRRLQGSGVPYFVNAVVSPKRLAQARSEMEFLARRGVRRVQLAYTVGEMWDSGAKARLLRFFKNIAQKPPRCGSSAMEIMNNHNDCEPVMLSDEVLVDTDGKIFLDPAIFLERRFPKLRGVMRLGDLDGIRDLTELRRSRTEILEIFRKRYPPGTPQGALFANNLGVGMELRRLFSPACAGATRGTHRASAAPADSENAATREGLIEADFAGQDRFLRRHIPGLDCLFYFVRSGCESDCVFCRAKPAEPGQPLSEVETALRQNQKIGRRKVALAGNEPPNHPQIAAIVRACRRWGFRDVEIMTSGGPLADPAFAKELAAAGATSFAIPLYSSDAGEHDAITNRKGSFKRALSAIENLKRLKNVRVFIHSNLLRSNLASMRDLEKLVTRKLKLPLCILPLRPKGTRSMREPYEKLAPSYAEIVAGYRGSSLASFPVCVMKRVQGRRLIHAARIAESVKLYILHQNFMKPDSCRGCSAHGRCAGTFQRHLDVYPKDLRLLRRP